ncbi:hypothetical protein BMI88_01585 [Thioclava sp. F36-6]|nr:hypothetical protein BMI88_01585 [Thioclava sp. F36-6]
MTSCGAGAYLLILSNSRGPVVSLTLAFTLLLLAKIQHKRLLSVTSFFIIGALVAAYLNRSLLFDNTGILYRFEVITSGKDMSTAGRLISTSGAWHQFLENPFFGNSLQEEITKFYPHNVILESLMSTGITGGIAFVIMVALALHASWAILRTSAKDSWIALISLQYIFGAQFSGAIYQSNTMWLSMSLVCALWWICRKRRAPHTEPAKRRSQPYTIS